MSGATYAATFLILCMTYPITHHFYYFGVESLSISVRVGCSALIYRKVGGELENVFSRKQLSQGTFCQVLRLSQRNLNKSSVGYIVNMISNDAQVDLW